MSNYECPGCRKVASREPCEHCGGEPLLSPAACWKTNHDAEREVTRTIIGSNMLNIWVQAECAICGERWQEKFAFEFRIPKGMESSNVELRRERLNTQAET